MGRAGFLRRRWRVLLALVLVAEFLLVAFLAVRDRSPHFVALERRPHLHVNKAGSFSFRPVPKWKLEERGSISKLVSPDGHAIVSFGLGVKGMGAEPLVDLLRRDYRSVKITDRDYRTIGGQSADEMSGTAVAATGVALDWTLVAVEAPDRTVAVTAFVSHGEQTTQLEDRVQDLIASLELP